ncbi:MAG: hypothetical protein AVDCRST_MAG68-965, partial [uncultured Gemmatimonadetes bacterium]
ADHEGRARLRRQAGRRGGWDGGEAGGVQGEGDGDLPAGTAGAL